MVGYLERGNILNLVSSWVPLIFSWSLVNLLRKLVNLARSKKGNENLLMFYATRSSSIELGPQVTYSQQLLIRGQSGPQLYYYFLLGPRWGLLVIYFRNSARISYLDLSGPSGWKHIPYNSDQRWFFRWNPRKIEIPEFRIPCYFLKKRVG